MEHSTRSPAWKNPRDRLVKHAKRKSNRSLVLSQSLESTQDDLITESCPPVSLAQVENPFKVCPPKKKKGKGESPLKELPFDWDDSTANDSFSSIVSTKIQQSGSFRSIIRSRSIQFGEFSLDSSDAENTFLLCSASNSPLVAEEKTSTSLPQDFRLGTKLRITSTIPFSWMNSEKTTGNVRVRLSGEEISWGMQYFLDFPNGHSNIPMSTASFSASSLLEAASLYWQFPSLPWLNLYPRIDNLLKTQPKQSAPPIAPLMVDKINEQWYSSLGQLFISWKKGRRKCFYVVCPSFTVVFNKTKLEHEGEQNEDSVSCFHDVNGQRHIAVISPTNLGLRQYLKSEGIEFELSSYKRRRLSRVKPEEANYVSEKNNHFNTEIMYTSSAPGNCYESTAEEKERSDGSVPVGSDHEGESPTKGTNGVQEWLDDIGVSPRNQLKLRRHKSMVSTVTSLQEGSSIKGVEKDCTSAVIITEGASLQSLFNLLQNSKITRSIAGVHANLPPTLIASEPFLFGQMLPLKKTSQVIKRQDQNTEYVLELDGGPIMPHCVETAVEYIKVSNLATTNSVTVRVKDKSAYEGLNGVDQSSEWHELKVEVDKFTWVPR